MGGQIPEGSEGVAVASVTFATISIICSLAIIWLTFVHNERLSCRCFAGVPLPVARSIINISLSDVALLAYFALMSTVGSMIQQIHVIAFYRDVVTEQFEDKLKNPTNPDSRLANGSVGMDLVLYYIRQSVLIYQASVLLI